MNREITEKQIGIKKGTVNEMVTGVVICVRNEGSKAKFFMGSVVSLFACMLDACDRFLDADEDVPTLFPFSLSFSFFWDNFFLLKNWIELHRSTENILNLKLTGLQTF